MISQITVHSVYGKSQLMKITTAGKESYLGIYSHIHNLSKIFKFPEIPSILI